MAQKEFAIDPKPESLVQALRAIGYSFEAAIADVIDNSISAGAKNINIQADWANGHPHLAIIDDGCGMTESLLAEAMRLGYVPVQKQRSPKDLGHFGLGLKTASISQCRKLSVLSKKDGESHAVCWDITKIASMGWKIKAENCQPTISNTILKRYHEDFLK